MNPRVRSGYSIDRSLFGPRHGVPAAQGNGPGPGNNRGDRHGRARSQGGPGSCLAQHDTVSLPRSQLERVLEPCRMPTAQNLAQARSAALRNEAEQGWQTTDGSAPSPPEPCTPAQLSEVDLLKEAERARAVDKARHQLLLQHEEARKVSGIGVEGGLRRLQRRASDMLLLSVAVAAERTAAGAICHVSAPSPPHPADRGFRFTSGSMHRFCAWCWTHAAWHRAMNSCRSG